MAAAVAAEFSKISFRCCSTTKPDRQVWGSEALRSLKTRPFVAARHEQFEQKLGSDRKRLARLDERAAARDVLGVVGEERVESLVFDLELDRTPLAGASLGWLVVAHDSLYQD